MEETRVTEKFQVTIPKKVREKMGIVPGEIMIVESLEENEVRLKRFKVVKDPVKILIGKRRFDKHISVKELEEKMESE
ncbi:MAG: AbrB/MazE/SpoVT family DNA-binding domain-containing protein [Candidatus Thermoplasmatota archaeon]|nr:AbrB/MazE/SpoVT family DNA-binding domain-containing protein [Candidatus Thermoplasmatota archaeon]